MRWGYLPLAGESGADDKCGGNTSCGSAFERCGSVDCAGEGRDDGPGAADATAVGARP